MDFNPRSPWGERRRRVMIHPAYGTFQSTLPVGGATAVAAGRMYTPTNFNPRSPWGERRAKGGILMARKGFQSTLPVGGATIIPHGAIPICTISIHAPRGGSDNCKTSQLDAQWISIHAPRGGSDPPGVCLQTIVRDFNPRSPWGERHGNKNGVVSAFNFNPRSPWGERQQRCTVLPAYLWRKAKF